MNMNELIKLPEEVQALANNVSKEKKEEVQVVLNHVFNGVSKMRDQLDNIVVLDENDKTNMQLAKTIRLGVRATRLEAEKQFDAKRNEVQQAMLSFKTEDSLWLKAKQTMQILTKEIEQTAKWKESTRERIENERKELKVQERILKVQKINPDILRSEVEFMSDDTFDLFFTSVEKKYKEAIEAERIAEEERLAKIEAERIEREKLIAENKRLQEQAVERERLAKIEENKRKKAEEARLAKEKKEREAHEEKLRKERVEREKLEAYLESIEEAERKAKEDEASRFQAELNKGDAAKVKDLIAELETLKTKYSFKSAKNTKMYADVSILIDKVISHIEK